MGSEGSRSDWVAHWIGDRPWSVVLLFCLLTAGFATGLDDVEMASGTEQFSEDVPAYGTNEMVEETFGPSFEADSDATLLLQERRNVLSKEGLLSMLTVQHRIEDRPDLRVSSTTSPASMVARELDPSARTLEDRRRTVEHASDSEIRRAVTQAATDPAFRELLGEDFNRESVRASAAVGVHEHEAGGDDEQLSTIQLEARRVATSADGDVRVFGQGITDYENRQVLQDSLRASIPAVVVLLVIFLAIAYRDPFDLALGVVSLAMALVWTFGFLGIAGIPFSQLQVSLPPLLLAIGVDFGIHTINRFREEFDEDVDEAMHRSVSSLLLAFFMVTLTSAIGFSANLVSGLSPIADFGMAAASGIVAVALVFGLFLPAAKLLLERLRKRTAVPSFDAKPLGAEDSLLGRLLPVHLSLTSRLPLVFLLVMVLSGGVAGYYGKDVGSSFEDEDMLPPAELPGYMEYLPDPMQPGTYSTTANLDFLETRFETTSDDTVTVYATGSLTRDSTLEAIHRAGDDPPSAIATDGSGHARSESVIGVIDAYAELSPSFAALLRENDRDGNGIPDQNLDAIYEELLASPYEDRARRYITDDYRETRVIYSVESDATDSAATAAASSIASDYRIDAVETGGTVVFQRVAEEVYESAVNSLLIALTLAAGFLVLVFYLLEGRALLGLVTMSPIFLTVVYLVGTMRFLGIPFNTLTATILSVTVGIGIDYAIHVVHRFVGEFELHGDPIRAARVTLRGTGGALFGTTVTTASAGVVLYTLSITPILVQFGLLIALSVTYSFLTSVVVLPVVLLVWTRWQSEVSLEEPQVRWPIVGSG